VKLSLLQKAPKRSDDVPLACLVSVETLAALSVHEKSFAFLCHGSERTLVRLVLLEEEDDDGETAMAPPIVFANLGIVDAVGYSQHKPSIKECWFESAIEQPPMAECVVLRPLGRNPKWPQLFSKEEDSSWALPPPNTLIEQSKLLSVFNSKTMSVFYYEILEILCAHGNESSTFCLTSKSTKLELDGSSIPSFVCRLPPLVSQENFYRGVDSSIIPPHPNLSEMMQALCQPPTLDATEKVLHVVGTDTAHRARLCVETAARLIGMQCLSIRGLAAFGHDQGNTIRTGSLGEQISGLQAAFQLIRTQRMEPCVLYLYDFDLELSSTDEPVRHEQEERFWAQWMQVLKTEPSDVSDNLMYTPPIIIVVSTSSPLQSGPLLEKLVFPSIVLDAPDMEFAKFLWKGSHWDDRFWDNKFLKGRNAQDIVWLCQQVQTNTKLTMLETLQNLCQELHTAKRMQSSKVARVSNVHWDDVGGLAHVRKEIMDAIELPLKYPHLFPSRGRSGILLYGPPGTGKTLVAKAVATECGLPFFSVKGPELLGSYVGESEASVRAIFRSARDAASLNAPIASSILFFDELDSLAPRRGGVGDGGGVMERVVATLFAELDGPDDMSAHEGRVFVMGATNRPDLLDPSLLRPGRLDRLVYLGVPTDDKERARVLAAQIRKLNLAGDHTELAEQVVATLPPRLTGADLSSIATGALSHAVQRLCYKADEEQRKIEEEQGIKVDIAQVLEGWDEKQRTPMVQLDDLLEASKEVTPSLSEKELERYERLREQYTCP
jgi:ATP-dependent 26S proteasome regulatory subunit